jgi:magnesium transporter
VLNLRDYVTQVREAYQAQIDIEQNTLMKVFTGSPPSSAPHPHRGLERHELRMPEFAWEHGYPFVIVPERRRRDFMHRPFQAEKWF